MMDLHQQMIEASGNVVALLTAALHDDDDTDAEIVTSLDRLQLVGCLAVSIGMLANYMRAFAEREDVDLDTALRLMGVAAAEGRLR